MTTDTKPDNKAETTEDNKSVNTATSNKAVFGPLGKYAVIAVIMVSIIVTTAIVLDKELNSVEQEIAVIEDEIAELTVADAEANTAESLATTSDVSSAASESVTITAVNTSNTQKETVASLSVTPVNAVSSAEELVVTEITAETVVTDSVTPVAAETATTVKSMQERQAQFAMNNQARIEAHKLEQKQHMSEMFTRIKTLEAQQLEQYKTRQDAQVEHLREQIAKQQQMIDSLISRNKELFELRAASVQKNQTNREQMLNRI